MHTQLKYKFHSVCDALWYVPALPSHTFPISPGFDALNWSQLIWGPCPTWGRHSTTLYYHAETVSGVIFKVTDPYMAETGLEPWSPGSKSRTLSLYHPGGLWCLLWVWNTPKIPFLGEASGSEYIGQKSKLCRSSMSRAPPSLTKDLLRYPVPLSPRDLLRGRPWCWTNSSALQSGVSRKGIWLLFQLAHMLS